MTDLTNTLTPKEKDFLKALVDHNEYGERGDLNNRPWSWAVCNGSKAKAAVLGSLVKKGLCYQEGRGRDASCGLTAEGKRAYLTVFGPEGVYNQDS